MTGLVNVPVGPSIVSFDYGATIRVTTSNGGEIVGDVVDCDGLTLTLTHLPHDVPVEAHVDTWRIDSIGAVR